MFAKLRKTLLPLSLAISSFGCFGGPSIVSKEQQKPIDRTIVDYPANTALVPFVTDLTAPTAIAVDNEEGPHKGTVIVAESGTGIDEPHIYAIKATGDISQLWPSGRPLPLPVIRQGFRFAGPIGGMVVVGGKILVSHRDGNGMGTITALGYDGSHTTIAADLPAQGDYGVTDIAVNPINGRVFFGVGSATNSGVVGLDNWAIGWVNEHPQFADAPNVPLKLLGYRFDTTNPKSTFLMGNDIAVTAPFQAFNSSNRTRIPPAINNKPSGAIYSVSPSGGDLTVEAHGIRYPRGLAFNEFGNLFFTNDGMELRGTRPVKDDPDALVRFVPGTWYGFPDFSSDFYPISDDRFRPPIDLIVRYGYPELSFLIDHEASGLISPAPYRDTLLRTTFPSQSGAAKMNFVPGSSVLKEFRGEAIVTLAGDRAPFGTAGKQLIGPIGHKVMRVDVDPSRKSMHDLIVNTSGTPGSVSGELKKWALERPCDVKFGPDGTMYLLDFGHCTYTASGQEKVSKGSGRIYKLVPLDSISAPTTQP